MNVLRKAVGLQFSLCLLLAVLLLVICGPVIVRRDEKGVALDPGAPLREIGGRLWGLHIVRSDRDESRVLQQD